MRSTWGNSASLAVVVAACVALAGCPAAPPLAVAVPLKVPALPAKALVACAHPKATPGMKPSEIIVLAAKLNAARACEARARGAVTTAYTTFAKGATK